MTSSEPKTMTDELTDSCGRDAAAGLWLNAHVSESERITRSCKSFIVGDSSNFLMDNRETKVEEGVDVCA